MTYWINPWEDAVPVPIEELAECHVSLGESCLNMGQAGKDEKVVFILTKEKVLEHWKNAGNKLDAYILPQPSGYHSIGIRYGAEDSEYLSPAGDKDKVQILLDKYKGRKNVHAHQLIESDKLICYLRLLLSGDLKFQEKNYLTQKITVMMEAYDEAFAPNFDLTAFKAEVLGIKVDDIVIVNGSVGVVKSIEPTRIWVKLSSYDDPVMFSSSGVKKI